MEEANQRLHQEIAEEDQQNPHYENKAEEEEQRQENEDDAEREGFNGDEEDFMSGYAPMDQNR